MKRMKIFLLLLIALLALGPSARAQQLGLIANTEGRKTISLNGLSAFLRRGSVSRSPQIAADWLQSISMLI